MLESRAWLILMKADSTHWLCLNANGDNKRTRWQRLTILQIIFFHADGSTIKIFCRMNIGFSFFVVFILFFFVDFYLQTKQHVKN